MAVCTSFKPPWEIYIRALKNKGKRGHEESEVFQQSRQIYICTKIFYLTRYNANQTYQRIFFCTHMNKVFMYETIKQISSLKGVCGFFCLGVIHNYQCSRYKLSQLIHYVQQFIPYISGRRKTSFWSNTFILIFKTQPFFFILIIIISRICIGLNGVVYERVQLDIWSWSRTVPALLIVVSQQQPINVPFKNQKEITKHHVRTRHTSNVWLQRRLEMHMHTEIVIGTSLNQQWQRRQMTV